MLFAGSAGGTSVDFVPDEDSRGFVEDLFSGLLPRLGEPATRPQLITGPERGPLPGSLDDFFDLICGLQAQIGQEDVEFTLLEMEGGTRPQLPQSFRPLGDPTGQLLHTFSDGDEYVMLFSPGIFRQSEIFFGSIARELGRLAIRIGGGHLIEGEDVDPHELEAESEVAATALGMGVWVVNGSYVFENSCCGGGCGLDLRSLRTGLSMPEAAYALALDARRKGLGRWGVGRHLQPTQKAAFRKNWGAIGKDTPKALASAASAGALGS